jgi:hypothetical protein
VLTESSGIETTVWLRFRTKTSIGSSDIEAKILRGLIQRLRQLSWVQLFSEFLHSSAARNGATAGISFLQNFMKSSFWFGNSNNDFVWSFPFPDAHGLKG